VHLVRVLPRRQGGYGVTQPCQSCSGRATLWICASCTNQLRDLLRSLVTGPEVAGRPSSGLLEDLADVVLKRTKLGSGAGHRKRGDDMPALYEPDTENGKRTKQAEAVMLLDAIGNGLSTIVRDICESRGAEYPALGTTGCARWLATNVGAIACDESAGVWHGEIHGYVRRIEHVIDRPMRRVWLGPCPTWNDQTRKACGTDLHAREDAIEVYCRACRATHNCNRLKLLQQGDLDREPITWEQLLKANRYQPDEFKVSERTLQVWRKAGKLKPRGWLRPNGRHGGTQRSTDDEPLYRWSDVRKLRAEKPQRVATGAAAHKTRS
jgi:hypothetical protein